MSLWVYFFPTRICSTPPTGSLTARIPSRSIKAVRRVDTGAEIFGTSTVRSFRSSLRYFTA